MEEETKTKKADYSVNWLVFWALVILTIGEYYLGVASDGGAFGFMVIFALLKALFIIYNYMNWPRLFGRGEEH
ncbi:MAG TPA: cytochrome C oxidase subunit IV family protein [Anaerolineales bacterium]|nr:cytochrome C oxidase subunit IV family protein [Anaerolineales bacterium]